MSALPEGEFLLPLFPLPNLVFFPKTRLPLHVFEPRYRLMIADALEREKRIGIILLRPGWERDYFGAPEIYRCGTVGTIEQVVPLDDGRYNLLIHGDVRFRVVDEVSSAPYRTAKVVASPESQRNAERSYAQREWLAELSRQYLKFLPDEAAVPEIATASLDSLTNALIMSLNLDVEEKQKLLETDDLIARAEQVGSDLENRLESLRFLAPYRRGSDPSRN
ncbi:MAG: LON peptidase substrate-binding domain-containing protein [Thermoanaerobaculia bacterium]|nr:LON peptidase substrate-binding domain-containing protein [Thermoanaerobaculia bacterium]